MTRGSILVVDDDPQIRALLGELLQDEGYAVSEAGNGQEALKVLETEPADLAIIDLMMPVMNGYELAAELREREPAEERLPFICVSAYDMNGWQAETLGAIAGMGKPINLDALLGHIERGMKLSTRGSAAA